MIDDKKKIENLEVKLRKIKKNYDALLNTKLEIETELIRLKKENEDFDPAHISLCSGCGCMTHTVNGKCGKCDYEKNEKE